MGVNTLLNSLSSRKALATANEHPHAELPSEPQKCMGYEIEGIKTQEMPHSHKEPPPPL